MNTKKPSRIPYEIAYLAWAVVSIFYFYQYILRVFPNVMVHQIRADFNMTAEQFSLLGAIYLYAYSLLQIPIGILIDKVGVKKIVTWSIVLCILGTYLITITYNPYLAYLSRFLIGAGSACAFISSIKIATDYLPAGYRGILIGSTLTMGTIGAVTAGKPVVSLMDFYGWRDSLLIIDACGLIILALGFFIIPKHHEKEQEICYQEVVTISHSIKEIFKNKNIIYYSIVAIGLYTPLSVLADLWATDFLMKKYNFVQKEASMLSSILYIGLGIGSFLFPWLTEKYKIINSGIRITLIALFISFATLLYGPNLTTTNLTILLLAIGIFCGGEMVCFTGAGYHTTPQNSGLTLGIVNTFNMFGAGIAQQLVGYILDLEWSGKYAENGVRYYSANEYVFALSFLVVFIGICIIISFFKKDDRKV